MGRTGSRGGVDRRLLWSLVLSLSLLLFLGLLANCRGDGEGDDRRVATAGDEERASLTLYSGRNENLIGPLLERFTATSGVPVEVRYGGTAELAATLFEEGEATPAAVFVSQDAAALGALAAAGRLVALPSDVVGRIPAVYRDPQGRWIGLSGRARVLVYNTDAISPDELPANLEEVGDPRYRGRFGVAPLNGSFQAQIAVYRALHGGEAMAELLRRIAANRPRTFPNNGAIVEATIAGEVDFGLVNHYYLWRALEERPEAPARNFFQPGGGAASYVNVAGVGVLRESPEALELVRFLVSEEAQRYFAEETFEYPLVPGVEPPVELEPLVSLDAAAVDYGEVSAVLEETLGLIRASGLAGP
ncbi:MAG TPA: extracellular solute-binding protein [Thermoanaerobaculia bacterium]|nr:extracellular solute-binding protein [Thermoanaerobaculia bacterium]